VPAHFTKAGTFSAIVTKMDANRSLMSAKFEPIRERGARVISRHVRILAILVPALPDGLFVRRLCQFLCGKGRLRDEAQAAQDGHPMRAVDWAQAAGRSMTTGGTGNEPSFRT
jgi:hypothetical protein